MYYQEVYDSPVGKMIMVSDGEHLNGLWIEGQSGFTDAVKEGMQPKEELSVFIMTKEWLDRYFAGDKPKISELPLQLSGTEFRRKSGNCSVRFLMEKQLLMEKLQRKWQKSGIRRRCLHRQSETQWGTTLYQSLFPAIV